MYCTHCGKNIAADARFCPYCGEPAINEPECNEGQQGYDSVMEGGIYVGHDSKKRFEAREILRMFGYLNDKRPLFEDYETKQFSLTELRKYDGSKEWKAKAWISFAVSVVTFILALILSSMADESSAVPIIGTLAGVASFITFALFVIFMIVAAVCQYRTTDLIEKTEKEIKNDWEEIRKYYSTLPACPIGVSWFTIAGINTILEMMKNNEAASIKEAIQKTTEAQARERMNREYIEAVEESGKTAARGAIIGASILAATNVTGRIFDRIRNTIFG